MNMDSRTGIVITIAFAAVLTGCEFDTASTGPMQTQQVSIDRGAADRANVEFSMGAGQMTLRGGANKLVEGTIAYNVAQWKPEVESSVNGSHATVTIRQPEHVSLGGNKHYEWDLALNDKVLTDLSVHCGAGQARLDLGDIPLRDLEVHMGAGQVDVDLRGTPTHDYEVTIEGGVGQATVRLPSDVGIWAEAHGGLGSITVTGLDKKDNHWENAQYDKAKVNLRLKVHGGIGEIRIIG